MFFEMLNNVSKTREPNLETYRNKRHQTHFARLLPLIK